MGGTVFSFVSVLHFCLCVFNINLTVLELATKLWNLPQFSMQWRSKFSFEDSCPHDVNGCSAEQAELTLSRLLVYHIFQRKVTKTFTVRNIKSARCLHGGG